MAQHDESKVKAALIYNIARFVQWPIGGEAASSSEPFVVGVAGAPRLADAIEEAVKGRLIQERRVSIVRSEVPAELADCHLVFVAPGAPARVEEIVESVEGRPVLIVGDNPQSCRQGAALCFFEEDKRIRIASNVDAAKARGLQVSSQLLKLARPVERIEEAH